MTDTNPTTVILNLVGKYGSDGVELLLDAFRSGYTNAKIARQYHVSEERVRQWKLALGTKVETYVVHVGINALTRRGA